MKLENNQVAAQIEDAHENALSLNELESITGGFMPVKTENDDGGTGQQPV